MTILETKELKKYYDSGEYITKALDGVSLEIEKIVQKSDKNDIIVRKL